MGVITLDERADGKAGRHEQRGIGAWRELQCGGCSGRDLGIRLGLQSYLFFTSSENLILIS